MEGENIKELYILTQGDYSEYHIVGVFSSEEKAKEYTTMFPDTYEECNIENYTVDCGGEAQYKNKSLYHVRMCRNGATVHIRKEDSVTGLYKYKFYDDKLICYVIAKDEKHAVKIANEKRSMILARGLWGKNE